MTRPLRPVVLALVASVLGACVPRATIPRPSTPLVATPLDALQGAPTSLAAGASVRIAHVTARQPNGASTVLLRRASGGLTSVVVSLRPTADGERMLDWTLGEALAYVLSGHEADQPTSGPWSALDWDVDRDGVRIAIRLSSDDAADVVAHIDRTLREVPIAAVDVDAYRTWCEESIEADAASLEGVMHASVIQLLYAESDPRSAAYVNRLSACRDVRVERVEAFRQRLLDPANLIIVVAGDFDPSDVGASITSSFGRWPRAQSGAEQTAEQATSPPSYRSEGPRSIGIDRSLMRTWLEIDDRAPPLRDGDSAEFLVIEQLLGAMFGSYSNLTIREASGAAYGVTAAYRPTCTDGTLRVATQTDPRFSQGALALLVDELRRVRGDEGGIRDAEFARAKARAYETAAYALDDSLGLATVIATRARCGLAPATLIELLSEIDRVTISDVEAAAHRWIRPDRAPVILVGGRVELRRASEYFGRRAFDSRAAPTLRRR